MHFFDKLTTSIHCFQVKLLFAYVKLVNVLQNGMTCAHIAAAKGSVAVIKELMRFNKVIITTARNKVVSWFLFFFVHLPVK